MASAGEVFWGGLAAAGLAYELNAIRQRLPEDTLSDNTRDLFRTDTPLGRVAFTITWGAFAAWFAHHILSGER